MKKVFLKYIIGGVRKTKAFANIDAYRASEFTNKLLDFKHLINGHYHIDLRPYPITPNQILVMPVGGGERYFSSALGREIWDDDIVHSSHMERPILREYAHQDIDEEWATHDWFVNNDYGRPGGSDCFIHHDQYYDYDYVYCEDIGDWRHMDDSYYNDDDECYYADEDSGSQGSGNPQQIHGWHSSGRMQQYWHRPSAGAIGFEIEKKHFIVDGQIYSHGEIPLSRTSDCEGWRIERDGSCGVELISPTFGIREEDCARTFAAFDKVSELINSPHNNNCGGHISFSYEGMNKFEIARAIKPAMPILMSIWRKRLRNSYAGSNIVMNLERRGRDMVNVSRNSDRVVELRLPPYVIDMNDLQFRYKLMCTIINATCRDNITDTQEILSLVRPLIELRYGESQAAVRLELVPDFTRTVNMETSEIAQHCPNNLITYYEAHLSRERREEVRELRRQERLVLQATEHNQVIAALENPRRRARTQELGTQFTVSYATDSGRRSRTIYVTASGLQYNNSAGQWGRDRRTIERNPEDFRVDVRVNDYSVDWVEHRRAGEVLGYDARLPQSEELQSVTITRGNLHRLSARSNIYSHRVYWGRPATYLCIADDANLRALQRRNWGYNSSSGPQFALVQGRSNGNGYIHFNGNVREDRTIITEEQYQMMYNENETGILCV